VDKLAGSPILNFAFFAKFRVGMLDAGATSMKSPCAVNLHNAVTVSQQRLGKRVAQLSPARMNDVCAALRFSLGCEANQ
jgi:mRNA-degrading endonuclease toxin of MazEF toxin-antitoxin module